LAKSPETQPAIVAKLSRGIEYLWKKNPWNSESRSKHRLPHQVKLECHLRSKKHNYRQGRVLPNKRLFPKSIEIDELLSAEYLPEKPVLYGRGAIIAELAQFSVCLVKNPDCAKRCSFNTG
jgi:hypothetical protein